MSIASLIYLGFLVLAQAAEESPTAEVARDLTPLVTGGGFCALVWYLLVKVIPKNQEAHQKEHEADRTAFLEALEAERDLKHKQNEAFVTVLKEQIDARERMARDQMTDLESARNVFRDAIRDLTRETASLGTAMKAACPVANNPHLFRSQPWTEQKQSKP